MECSRRRRKAKLKKRSRTSTPAADVLNVVAAYGRMNYLIHDFDGRFSFGGHWLRWCLVRVMDLRGSRARRCHLAAGFATRHEEHNNQIAEIHYFTLVTFMVSSFSSHVIIRIFKKCGRHCHLAAVWVTDHWKRITGDCDEMKLWCFWNIISLTNRLVLLIKVQLHLVTDLLTFNWAP